MLVLGAYLGACSDVPDAVNPVSWYHGVEGWFEDDEAPAPEVKTAGAAETAKTPGEGKSFPSVNEVPEKPATGSTVEQRREMMQELGADKANAQYVGESESAAAESAGDMKGEMGTGSETEVAAAQAPAGGEAPPSVAKPLLDLDSPLPPPDQVPPPLTEDIPPPPPPSAPGAAISPPSPGSGELDQVYEQKLKESAPTVTTAVAGPTAPAPGAGMAGVADGEMESVPPPQFAAPASPVMEAEMQLAATTMPPSFLGPSTQVATIYFGNNSAAIRDSEAKKIREIAEAYNQRGGRLRILGYASSRTADMDPVQHQMVNFAVSVRRADAVTRALVNHGVKAEDIYATALSDSQPIYYESMPAGEAGNRRVEIFVDYY